MFEDYVDGMQIFFEVNIDINSIIQLDIFNLFLFLYFKSFEKPHPVQASQPNLNISVKVYNPQSYNQVI